MSALQDAGKRFELLVVDAGESDTRRLQQLLVGEGYGVRTATSARQIEDRLATRRCDLALLEIALPDGRGLDVLRKLVVEERLPTIILSRKTETADKVIGLGLGAEDYVAKPFDERELLARIERVRRRIDRLQGQSPGEIPAEDEVYAFAGWRLDVATQELVSPDGIPVSLTTGELALLACLVAKANRAVSRDRLLDAVSSRSWSPSDRSVDMLISKLRRKLGDDRYNPRLIGTTRGLGYKLIAPVQRGLPGLFGDRGGRSPRSSSGLAGTRAPAQPMRLPQGGLLRADA